MPIKRSLEQPIINAIIRYAYALREDEEAALLSAFLVISYHIHREAVETLLPDDKYDQLMSTDAPETGAEEAFIETISEPEQREPLIIGHIRHVLAAASSLPEYIKSAIITPVHTAITKPFEAAAMKIRHSIQIMSRRNRESLLQEEEERALFSTIEGVANQVQREAIESQIVYGRSLKGRFAAAYEREDEGPSSTTHMPFKDIVTRKVKNDMKKQPRRPMDTYSEFMEEEIMFIGRIIDRNRALSQGYLNT
jgi:hypothetical protein